MKITIMTKIENIWLGLENEISNHSGLLYKRYSADVLPDVFIALKNPEKLRCIAFRISAAFPFNESQCKDIKIETLPDERDQSKRFLLILLLNKQHKDIFSTLCEDLIFGVSRTKYVCTNTFSKDSWIFCYRDWR